ncbi:MAG: WD40 repeat domain-containing protein [Candidatus Lokiarchaeota archaeon]|nr:WD40 repeat domain-containing protein [Candidatus Lokiarchaeota archaeon]
MRFDFFDMAPEDGCVWAMLDREAKAWEGKIPARGVGHGGPWPNSLAFSPDGKLLANGAFGHIQIHDTKEWKHVHSVRWNGTIGYDKTSDLYKEFDAHYMEHWFSTVRFSPDGRTIYASENEQRGTAYAWDVATGELRWRRENTWLHAVSPDGKYLACSPGNTVCVLDAASGAGVFEVSLETTVRPKGTGYRIREEFRA